jgi:multiple sugar transport system substrate-binding protein
LRFSWWGGDARAKIYNEICDRFEADNPGIKVVREPASWNDYFTKLATQVAGGGAPDIIQMHPQYVKLFSANGVLLDLNDPIPKGVIDLSHFSPAAIQTGVIDGRNVMISIGLSTNGFIVNTAILKELDIPLSRLDSLSWDSFAALCGEIVQKSGGRYYAYVDDSFTPNEPTIQMFLRSRGKEIYTPDGKLGFDKQDLTDWLNYYAQLRAAGAIPSAEISAEDSTKTFEQSLFVAGKVAFHINSCNRLKIYQDLMPAMPLILARAPTTNGKGGEVFGSANIAINGKTKQPEAAAKFLNYFVNNPRSLELYKAENGFPASSAMNQYVYALLDPSNQQASRFMETVLSAPNTNTNPYVVPPANSMDILRLLGNESQAAAFGRKTVDKAVDDFFAAAARL